MSSPSNSTRPPAGRCAPAIVRSSVDLPGAVGADEREGLALGDREADVPDCAKESVARIQVLDLEQGQASARPR